MKGWLIAGVLVLSAAMLAAACGGDSGGDKNEGAATAAVAEFFVQERDGGRLPEGIDVTSLGVTAEDVQRLEVRSEDSSRSVKARYCMRYRYQETANGFKDHWRVYVAELTGGVWSVNSVKPDGTCDGVE